MKSQEQKKWNKKWLILIVLPFCLLTGCIYLDSVVQPVTITAGENMVVTLKVRVEPNEARPNTRLVVGFLAPKSWHADENTTMTYTEPKLGQGTLSRIPDTDLANDNNPLTGDVIWKEAFKSKYGSGDNYLPDSLEWIVFWTNESYLVANGDKYAPIVTITTKVGVQNVSFKPSYAICSNTEQLYYTWDAGKADKILNKSCITVINGEGDLLDCCNPPIANVTPGFSLDNDLITIAYDKSADSTATQLNPFSDNYLMIKGIKTNSEVVVAPTKLLMKKVPIELTNKFDVTFWPRNFLNLQEGETLQRIEYYFTDESGQVKVGYANTSSPFIYNFSCK